LLVLAADPEVGDPDGTEPAVTAPGRSSEPSP